MQYLYLVEIDGKTVKVAFQKNKAVTFGRRMANGANTVLLKRNPQTTTGIVDNQWCEVLKPF